MVHVYKTFRTALRALRRNVMRSALTCLGIVIGIAAVIAMAEIGQGSSYMIQKSIASVGANQIGVEPGASHAGGVSAGAQSALTLTPEDAAAIARECPAVQWAAPSVDARAQLIYGNKNWGSASVKGTTPDYLNVRNWEKMAAGSAFTDEDVRRAAEVCVIGQTVADGLFGKESPVGKEIRLKNIGLKVVGVLPRKGANMTGRDQDDIIVLPYTTVRYRLSGSKLTFANGTASPAAKSSVNSLNAVYPSQSVALYPPISTGQTANTPMVYRFNDLDDIYVSAVSPEMIDTAMEQIRGVLRERHKIGPGEEDDFDVHSSTEISQALGNSTLLVTKLLLIVSAISLVVGGVGIMNIMLVSVTERTREIGLRMAVGARGRDILRQFLIEATLLCLIGGAIGIGVGRLTSHTVSTLMKWPVMSSATAIIAAVAVSATVGIVFGYYPAWKASRLDPIEALRYE